MHIKSKKAKILVTSIMLSVLFNYFFLFARLGISVFLFNTVLLTIGYYCIKDEESFNTKKYIVSGIIILVLSIPFFRFDFELFKVLNFALIIGMYGLIVHSIVTFNIFQWLFLTIESLFLPLFKLNQLFLDLEIISTVKKKGFINVIVGLVLACMFLIFVGPILLSSDLVFSNIIERMVWLSPSVVFRKAIFRFFIFVFFSSYIYSHLGKKINYVPTNTLNSPKKIFNITSSYVFLICINLVYLAFSFIQIKYLFLGNKLPDGLYYAQYAREGFFQLVFVSTINIIVVTVFNHFKKNHILTNGLLLITVLCTYIMTFSAFYRMSLYESTYGYTRLRLLVYLFLIAESIALIPILIGIFKPNFKFLEYATIAVFTFYILLTFINIDAFIAERNIDRYMNSNHRVKLDYDYLSSLSLDALPVIDEHMEEYPKYIQKSFKKNFSEKQARYSSDFTWYEWNMSR
ncbi:MAG: hypothetical protein CVU84_07655 [Firmicutes bacterium HGW-Firmicutes-1]|jgi:hypothetical protein|nr:MAG: hypothetical protein CVU84_07655 [Firmicutes bacterium HGW-Firmicutes-1]